MFGARQTTDFEEVDHVDDIAGEVADVATAQHRAGAGGDHRARPLDAGEKHTLEVAETGGIDGLADQRAVCVDPERNGVRLGCDCIIRPGASAVAQESRGGEHQHRDPDRRDRADPPR